MKFNRHVALQTTYPQQPEIRPLFETKLYKYLRESQPELVSIRGKAKNWFGSG